MFKTLYSKLVAVLLLLFCLLAALFFFLLKFSFEAYQDAVTQEFNRTLAAQLITEYLTSDDDITIDIFQQRFNMAMRVNPALENYLLDSGGHIRASAVPIDKVFRAQVDMAPVRRFLNGKGELPIRGDDPLDAERRKIFSAAPVHIEDAGDCYLYVILGGEQYDVVADRFRQGYLLRQSGWVMGAGLICALLVTSIVFALITGKLRRLSVAMNSFRRSNFKEKILFQSSKSPVGSDEIDRLGETYNEMVEHITSQFRELQNSDEERRELIANVSHDLRTPLAALRGYLETLLMKEDTLSENERHNYLEIATRQGERLTTLVSRLFELAKLEGGQVVLNREMFQLGDLIEDVAQKFGLAASQRTVEIGTCIPDNDPFVFGDIGLIERILENLIENALRHTPAGGSISLTLIAEEKQVAVEISDTGSGIAQEDLPHIFNRFYRGDKSRRQHTGNAGLGLAIVKSILALHGSEIDVISPLGQGACFRFTLPTAKELSVARCIGDISAANPS